MGTVLPLRHPEQANDETFIGYHDENGFSRIAFVNKRRGTLVIEKGARVDQTSTLPDYRRFPVFVSTKDVDAYRRALYGMTEERIVRC